MIIRGVWKWNWSVIFMQTCPSWRISRYYHPLILCLITPMKRTYQIYTQTTMATALSHCAANAGNIIVRLVNVVQIEHNVTGIQVENTTFAHGYAVGITTFATLNVFMLTVHGYNARGENHTKKTDLVW